MSRTRSKNQMTAMVATAAFLALAGMFAVAGRAGASDPDPFFGIISQRTMEGRDFDNMEWGRLGSYRLPVDWAAVQHSEDGPLDWMKLDSAVAATAERDIELLPTLYNSPWWLSKDRRRMPIWGPHSISSWKGFLVSAVARYGTDGTFWLNHPELPYRPIMKWQIWNEPNIVNFARPVSPRRYAKLVKISARAIRRIDPDARIVAAGLYGKPPPGKGMESSRYFDRLYRTRGFRSSFNIAAIHPYATSTRNSVRRTFPLRRVLNRHGNRRKRLVISELGWGSDSATAFGLGSAADQALQLQSAYRKFLHHRRTLKLAAIYWFSWNDLPAGTITCSFCLETGLFDSEGEAKPAWYRMLDFTHGI